MRSSNSKAVSATIASSAAVVLLASTAGAGITDPFLTITAINANGTDTFTVPLANTTPGANPGSAVYSNGMISLPNSGATVQALTLTMDPQGPLNTPHDNLISFTFTAWAGSANTQFIITTGQLLLFPEPVLARASSNLTATDQNGDGVVVNSLAAGGGGAAGWWRTQFNGGYGPDPQAVPLGSQYALNGAASISTFTPFGTASGGNNTGILAPIAPGWTDMSAQLRFDLTAGDSFGGTSVFISSIVIPAPGAAVVLALGGIAAGRRRR